MQGFDRSKFKGDKDHLARHALDGVQEQLLESMRTNNANYNVATVQGGQDLTDVPFSDVKYYGSADAGALVKMAARIGEELNLSGHDMEVLRAAALYANLGRTAEWFQPDPTRRARSVERAMPLLKGTAIADDVRLVLSVHELPPLTRKGGGWASEDESKRHPRPTHPMYQALWDAECYEAARVDVGGVAGTLHYRERYQQVLTPWAQIPEHKQRRRRYLGWAS